MIDDEANFDNILDVSEQVQKAAKFQPKKRAANPRKATQPSKSAAPNPNVQTGDRKAGALNQFNSSKGLTSQERASLLCPGSEAVDNRTGSQNIPETPPVDAATAPLGPLPGASAADSIPQDDRHNDDSSNLATHQENMVVSDIHVSPARACGRTIDDMVEFGETFDAQTQEERVAKFQPKIQVKLLKATTKSRKTNKKVEASTVDVVTHSGSDNNMQTILHDDEAEDPRSHKSVQTPDSEGLFATDIHISEFGSLANFDSFPEEESVQEETAARFRPKLRPRPAKASSKVAGTNSNLAAATPMGGTCADNNDMCTKPKDQETMTCPASQDVHATIGLDSPNKLMDPSIVGSQSIVGEVSAVPTFKHPPTVGREKDKSKSVSFALSDASGVVTPTDANSEMGGFDNSFNDNLVDENLSNSSQMAERHYIDEEQHSNDQAGDECGYHEGDPLDPVEQQPKSNVREIGSSMKLRSRKGLRKTLNHSTDDCSDEDFVEPSLAEGDNVSGDEHTAVMKRKVRKKSRDGVQESQQQKVQKDKSQISSRGRKRTLKDELAEKPEKKKLTHRIRRTKEVKTLLETPREEIDPMKLSAAHLRLLQEARERVNPKQIPSEPSSNTSNFQLEDMDDFDYRDDEARNFDNDRTENHVQNATKLNYHSYMNKPTRGKWSKSDTDLFYEGLRQFGSDFAMIQQLFPDKTRHQVRQKFKSEERKNPMLVNDAIIHRSGDNQYFKKVIKQLNIEDVLPEVNSTRKQDGASTGGGPGNENVLDDFTNEDDFTAEEGDGSNAQVSGVQEEHVSRNDDEDDDLGDVFDWY